MEHQRGIGRLRKKTALSNEWGGLLRKEPGDEGQGTLFPGIRSEAKKHFKGRGSLSPTGVRVRGGRKKKDSKVFYRRIAGEGGSGWKEATKGGMVPRTNPSVRQDMTAEKSMWASVDSTGG